MFNYEKRKFISLASFSRKQNAAIFLMCARAQITREIMPVVRMRTAKVKNRLNCWFLMLVDYYRYSYRLSA